jgi:hypothetical protein
MAAKSLETKGQREKRKIDKGKTKKMNRVKKNSPPP